MARKFIIICGPTASGKSSLALRIAHEIDAVIINADSQQVYKDLQILSARPSDKEMKIVPHYLYGILHASDVCNAAKWLEMVRETLKQIPAEKNVIFVGGTGMYINALLKGITPIPEIPENVRKRVRKMSLEEVEKTLKGEVDGTNNLQRMKRALEVELATGRALKDWHKDEYEHEFSKNDFLTFCVNIPRETLYEKIDGRFAWMIENGAIDEVKYLMTMGLSVDFPIMKALGTPEIIDYINEEISLAEAVEKAQTHIRNYAKRQMTWFRNQLKDKIEITNFDDELILKEIGKFKK